LFWIIDSISKTDLFRYFLIQTVRHYLTSTEVPVLPWRYDAEMGAANSLHATAYYGEYNERFNFIAMFLLSMPFEL